MPDTKYPDLTQIAGRVVREPTTKPTSKGDVLEFKVSVQRSYGKGDGDFGETKLVTVAVWNEDLQARVADEVIKGMNVAVEGTLKPNENPEYADMRAFRVGPVAWIAKTGSRAASKARPEDAGGDDF